MSLERITSDGRLEERVFHFTFAYVLPNTDLDGVEFEVEAANETEAFALARRRVDQVTTRIALLRVGDPMPFGWRTKSDASIMFDFSDLDGGVASVAEFLSMNAECPPDDSEIAALRAAPLGGVVHLGIGGGFVSVRRVA